MAAWLSVAGFKVEREAPGPPLRKTSMQIHPSITADRIETAIAEDADAGFCTACGTDAEGVEPDARQYRCDACGEHEVYGAEELAFMTFA